MKQPSIHPLLDVEKQEKARCYEREKRLIGLGSSVWTLLLVAGFYFLFSRRVAFDLFPGSFLLTFFAYTAAFQSVLWVLGLPWSFYSGFLHEHNWGFSNQSRPAWLWDQVKSLFLGLILFWLLLGLLIWILARFPHWWWLVAGLSTAAVGVVLSTLFPVVILPLFFKYTPIEDAELVGALKKILEREGLRPGGFFVENLSRKSKKENAFLAGLGRTRRVVLADNLLAHMDGPQIESIIAHEVGHYRYRHIWKNILIGTLEQLMVFFLADVIMRSVFPSFLSSPRHNLALLPVFLAILGGLSTVLFGPLSQYLSRHFERQADIYALRNIKDATAFKLALAGLADRNLSNAYPAEWVKWLYYSHPPIGERLAAAEKFQRYS